MKRKEDLADPNIDCSTLLSCFSHVLNLGIRYPQGFGKFFKNYDEGENKYWEQLALSYTFWVIINIMLLVTMYSNIVGAFGQIRVENNTKNDYIRNSCILCGLTRKVLIKNNIDFEAHWQKDHYTFDYLGFLHYLKEKGTGSKSSSEYHCWTKYKEKDPQWIPHMKTLKLEAVNTEEKIETTFKKTWDKINNQLIKKNRIDENNIKIRESIIDRLEEITKKLKDNNL